MESELYGVYDLLLKDVTFEARGTIDINGTIIDATEMVTLGMATIENTTPEENAYFADIKIDSQGTQLISGGYPIGTFEELLVPKGENFRVPIVRFANCK